MELLKEKENDLVVDEAKEKKEVMKKEWSY